MPSVFLGVNAVLRLSLAFAVQVQAYEETQKYKEGKFIIEKARVTKVCCMVGDCMCPYAYTQHACAEQCSSHLPPSPPNRRAAGSLRCSYPAATRKLPRTFLIMLEPQDCLCRIAHSHWRWSASVGDVRGVKDMGALVPVC